jgi:hypothetical protein
MGQLWLSALLNNGEAYSPILHNSAVTVNNATGGLTLLYTG